MKIGITRKLAAVPGQYMHLMAAAAQRGHYIFGKEFIAPHRIGWIEIAHKGKR